MNEIMQKHKSVISILALALQYNVISLSLLSLFSKVFIFFVLDFTVFTGFLSELVHKVLL